MAERIIIVKMGEMAVVWDGIKEVTMLKTTLGSCIGIVLTDRERNVSGLSHIMLPSRSKDDPVLGKYADTAIPLLIEKIEKRGGKINNLKAYVVGGATMFGNGDLMLNIGMRNYEVVKAILEKYDIPIVYEDVGGNSGRTVTYNHNYDEINVKTLSKGFKNRKEVEV